MPPRIPWPSESHLPYHSSARQEHASIPKAVGPTPNFPPNVFFPLPVCKHTSVQSPSFPFNSSIASSATPLKYLRGSLPSPSWVHQTLPPSHWLIALSVFCCGLVSLLHWIASSSQASQFCSMLYLKYLGQGLAESRCSIHTYRMSVYFCTSKTCNFSPVQISLSGCSQVLSPLQWEHPLRQREIGLIFHPTCAGQSNLRRSLEGVTFLLGVSANLLPFIPCVCWTFSILKLPAGHSLSLILTHGIPSQGPVCQRVVTRGAVQQAV